MRYSKELPPPPKDGSSRTAGATLEESEIKQMIERKEIKPEDLTHQQRELYGVKHLIR